MRLRRHDAVVCLAAAVVVSWADASHAQSPPAPAGAAPAAEPPAPPPPPAEPPPPPPPAPPLTAAAPSAPATFTSPGGDWKFGFHGFTGASFFVQDTPSFVFNGQGILLPLAKPAGGITTGADVRQSRFNFSIAGPKVFGGATPKALVEIDFFGLNGVGGFGEVSVFPRLRLAYAELNWGNDVLRFGQDHELIIGLVPESIGHMAFPVTYFNGFIGWREPGIGFFHTIPMEDSKLELAVQVLKSDWENPEEFGNSTLEDLDSDLGQLSGLPGVEARVKFTSDHVMAFVAGHYNHVAGTHANDLLVAPSAGTPLGVLTTAPTRDWDVMAATAGLKLQAAGFTLGVNGYYGKNLAPFLGEQLQFIVNNDVSEWGAWGEIGYDIMKTLNIYVVGGTSQPTQSDIEAAINANDKGAANRLSSAVIGGMIRFQEKGFAVGPEYYHVIAKTTNGMGQGVPAGAGALNGTIEVNQAMMSGMYFF